MSPIAAQQALSSARWYERYLEAASQPSAYRLGPQGSGLELVRSEWAVGGVSGGAGGIEFDDSEQFWMHGPVTSAFFRGGSHMLYALKPVRQDDGLDTWELYRNQSSLHDFYGVRGPASEDGLPFEAFQVGPYFDYIVDVLICYKSDVEVERLFWVTRTGRQYQLGRGPCTHVLRERAPPGGCLAGFAGRYLNASAFPPRGQDASYLPVIQQLRLIWAAPKDAGPPKSSFHMAPWPPEQRFCRNESLAKPALMRSGQFSCGLTTATLCASNQCCGTSDLPPGYRKCRADKEACQFNCLAGYGMCGAVPEQPFVQFIQRAAPFDQPPTVYFLKLEEQTDYQSALSYCRALLFWVAADPAHVEGAPDYACTRAMYGQPRTGDYFTNMFFQSSCNDKALMICKASGALDISPLAAQAAAQPQGGTRTWKPGHHTLSLSRRIGSGPFFGSCLFSSVPRPGNMTTPTGPDQDAWLPGPSLDMQQPIASIGVSVATTSPFAINTTFDVTEQIVGIRLAFGAAAQAAPGDPTATDNNINSDGTSGASAAATVTLGDVASDGWSTFLLAEGEVVTAVSGCAGGYVERLVLHTSGSRLWTAPWSRTSLCSASFLEAAPPGGYLVGLQGYTGYYVEALRRVLKVPFLIKITPTAASRHIGGEPQTTGELRAAAGGSGNGSCMDVVPVPTSQDSTSTSSSDQQLRVKLGRNLLIDWDSFLGRGAAGIVRRGTLHAPGGPIPVAVKLLDAPGMGIHPSEGGVHLREGGSDPTGRFRSLAHEVHVLSRLNHPNIVRYYGACLQPPHPFVVEELMATPLSRLIHAKAPGGGPLHEYDLVQMLHIARDVAAGLAYLHPTVVHRDLKPGNVLLDAEGAAKIADFGLARFKHGTFLPTTEAEVGTAAYMAPELFTPDGADCKVTDRADVYSLGMLIYEMATRRRPWASTVNAAIGYLVAVQGHRPQLPPADDPLCPPAIRALLERCWAANPAERPSSAELVKRLTLLIMAAGGGGAGGGGGQQQPQQGPGGGSNAAGHGKVGS
ncbi:hypothetical protein GPECTOR_28g732 [Gonium pectorale]|uniref:Protein kinase domain-containing protein n=1 Tax=Gonium pectorale TaxID=33097 RepID=A0A150GER9_GONPE|nr:hypothetical protein GPECTOR_28g732 [Gonium pectorale]|eukprot:KXZ48326.1 hypothetical protein GPECTOR_28g732 [Gonium pectorale]